MRQARRGRTPTNRAGAGAPRLRYRQENLDVDPSFYLLLSQHKIADILHGGGRTGASVVN